MLTQAFLSFALLACGTIAAPTPSASNEVASNEVEKRAVWQQNKCDANVKITMTNNPISGDDLYWEVNIVDTSGSKMGGWGAKNPKADDRNVQTTKGKTFYVRGQPASSGTDASDPLTLWYDQQVWNSKDCYKYEYTFGPGGFKTYHNWQCQFDC